MSQKKNPSGLETLLRNAMAVRHLGLLDEYYCLTAGGGDDRYFKEAFHITMNNLTYLRGILETTSFNKKRMRELCNYGFICNADLCRILVQERKLPWRTAHQITATMTRLARREGKEMADVTSEFLDKAAMECVYYGKPLNMGEEAIREAFNPDKSVRNLRSHGSTAPERLREQIASSLERLRRDKCEVEAKRLRLKAAAEKLERAIDMLIAG
jgi:argininosuccinate lyase